MGVLFKKTYNLPIGLILILLALFFTLYIALENNEDNFLALLPAAFAFVSILFFKVYSRINSSVLYLFYIFTAFIRFNVVPFIMVVADYQTDYAVKSEIYQNLDGAIFLMIYELIIVFALLYFFADKNKNITSMNLQPEYPFHATNVMMLALFGMFILFLVLQPGLAIMLHSDSSELETQWKIIEIINNLHTSMSPVIFWGFKLVLGILQIILPIYIYNWAYLSLSGRKSALVGMLMVLMSLAIMTDARAISVFVATCLILVLAKNQGKYMQKLLPFLGLVIFAVICAALLKDQGFTGSQIAHISTAMQGYFGSPIFTAGVFVLTDEISFQEIIKDILTPVPLLGMFVVDFDSTNQLVNNAMFGSTIYGSIFPMIGEGARFFTCALAPILSALTIYIGARLEIRFQKHLSQSGKLNLLTVYFIYFVLMIIGISPNMYDFSILIGYFANFAIIYVIFYAPFLRHFSISKKTH